MSVTPVSRLSLPLQNAENLLADSTTFRSLMGADSAANAKARIFWYETDDEHVSAQATFPRTIISYAPNGMVINRISTSGWNGGGPIEVRIEAETAQSTLQDGIKDWLNKIGAIMEEIAALSHGGTGQYLDLTKVYVMDVGRMDNARNNGETLYGVCLVIEWKGMLQ